MSPALLEAVFEAVRRRAHGLRNASCPTCGSPLVYFDACLSTVEGDRTVTFPMGFCDVCDGLPFAAPQIH
jgi:hypothetical protein